MWVRVVHESESLWLAGWQQTGGKRRQDRHDRQDGHRWAQATHQSLLSRYSELRSKTDRPALASCSKSGSGMSGFAEQVSPRCRGARPESP